jgi:hypothetical protein
MPDMPMETNAQQSVPVIAACGLFCTNCGAFKKGKCKGCKVAPMFKSCPIRACCGDKGIANCSACADFTSPRDYRECGKLHNWISRFFGLILRSDRIGALTLLRDEGEDAYLAAKRESGKH